MKTDFFFNEKNIIKTVLGKGLSASIKEYLCLRKGHLDKPEGQVEVESSLIRSCFDTFDSN